MSLWRVGGTCIFSDGGGQVSMAGDTPFIGGSSPTPQVWISLHIEIGIVNA